MPAAKSALPENLAVAIITQSGQLARAWSTITLWLSISVQFGTKLLRLRSEQQVELAELSAGSGILSDRLAALETGKAAPSGDEVLILADFFKCDYRFFVSNERLAASEQTESLYRRYGTEFTKSDRRAVLEFLYLCECERFASRRNFRFRSVRSALYPMDSITRDTPIWQQKRRSLISPMLQMPYRSVSTSLRQVAA